MIDIGRAVQHPFQDQNWVSKLGIGALIGLVPILNFALSGYAVEHLRNTASGQDVPLPTWDNLGEKFVDGLKMFVVTFVLSLPLVLLSCILSVAGGGLAAVSGDSEAAANAAMAGLGLIGLVIACVSLIYGLLIAYLTPAITIQYAKTKDIGACLRIGELLNIARTNTGDYIMIFLVIIGVSFAIGIIASVLFIIPCLGWILGYAIAFLVTAYLAVLIGNLCGQYVRNNNVII
jgi:hypothetical protein